MVETQTQPADTNRTDPHGNPVRGLGSGRTGNRSHVLRASWRRSADPPHSTLVLRVTHSLFR